MMFSSCSLVTNGVFMDALLFFQTYKQYELFAVWKHYAGKMPEYAAAVFFHNKNYCNKKRAPLSRKMRKKEDLSAGFHGKERLLFIDKPLQ